MKKCISFSDLWLQGLLCTVLQLTNVFKSKKNFYIIKHIFLGFKFLSLVSLFLYLSLYFFLLKYLSLFFSLFLLSMLLCEIYQKKVLPVCNFSKENQISDVTIFSMSYIILVRIFILYVTNISRKEILH